MFESKIYLANCSHSPQHRRVRGAVEAYLDLWLSEGMDWDAWMAECAAARTEFARLIGAKPSEIAMTSCVSAAVAAIASSLEPSRGRAQVVTTEAEFPTVGQVWRGHEKYGLQVEFVPLRDGALALKDYECAISERTLLVSATHVYYQNGFKQDIAEIARLAHDAGSLLLVDAYQSLGTCQVDVNELDIDILVAGNLKYLLGIPGVAFIYVKEELTERFEPALTGWFGRVNPFEFDPRATDYAPDARRFETGTPPIIAAAAARAGMEIINEVGLEKIERRIKHLSEHLLPAIRDHELELASTEDLSRRGAVTAIRVPDPDRAERKLRALNIVTAARGDVIRIAPHFFNTTGELDLVVETLADYVRQAR